jgi:CubicO group peptidase (beta-lactamase class C family)
LPALTAARPTRPPEAPILQEAWNRLDGAVEAAIAAKTMPGAVLLVGHRGKVVYRKAFGARSVQPAWSPMTVDTVFDVASLTKVVATTSAVAALVEDGKLRLEDPVARYWPEFGAAGKSGITVRHLLTHTSGLQAWINFGKTLADPLGPPLQDYRAQVIHSIAALPPRRPPGTRLVYSDLGFIALGELVERVSGEPLDQFAQRRIFEPLGMHDTHLQPRSVPPRARCADGTLERAVPEGVRAGSQRGGVRGCGGPRRSVQHCG